VFNFFYNFGVTFITNLKRVIHLLPLQTGNGLSTVLKMEHWRRDRQSPVARRVSEAYCPAITDLLKLMYSIPHKITIFLGLLYHFCDYAVSDYRKNLVMKRHKPAPLFYLLSIGFRVRRRLSEIKQNCFFFFF
jgi:hypothetical protein